jgi:hypothetical protein
MIIQPDDPDLFDEDMADVIAEYHTTQPTQHTQASTWPNSQYSMADGEAAAAFLFGAHPSLHEDLIYIALEQSNNDTAAASAWCTVVEKADGALKVLSETFPTADPSLIKQIMLGLNGDVSRTYCSLANTHVSSHPHPVSEAWLRVNALPARLTNLAPSTQYEPDFHHTNPRFEDYEERWWDSLIESTKFRSSDPKVLAAWDIIAPYAISRLDVSPRMARYVENLNLRHRDAPTYNEASCILRSLPTYKLLLELINIRDITEPALTAIKIMMNEGIANPASACWAADTAILSPDEPVVASLLSSYHLCNNVIWNARNAALRARKHVDDMVTAAKKRSMPTSETNSTRDASPTPPVTVLGPSPTTASRPLSPLLLRKRSPAAAVYASTTPAPKPTKGKTSKLAKIAETRDSARPPAKGSSQKRTTRSESARRPPVVVPRDLPIEILSDSPTPDATE